MSAADCVASARQAMQEARRASPALVAAIWRRTALASLQQAALLAWVEQHRSQVQS